MKWSTNPVLSFPLIRLALWQAEKRKRPLIASINVVNRCNLHCAGCYWTKTEREEDREELSLEDGAELIHRLWKRGTRHFFFIGGEPMTEREKVERWVREVARFGGVSIIVTNGTYGLPAPNEWPRTRYYVSCDGDRQGMDRVRGFDVIHKTSVFEQVKTVAMNRKDVKLAMTISKLNVDRIGSPRCPTFIAQSIRADGQLIERCIFGPEGDCSRCGCNIYTSFVAIREGDHETARFLT
ncbi:MAG: radical SAM protein [Chloroflexi bacterium]|nr:MAG: radical SAM protein [Chloroflexota bacterium]